LSKCSESALGGVLLELLFYSQIMTNISVVLHVEQIYVIIRPVY